VHTSPAVTTSGNDNVCANFTYSSGFTGPIDSYSVRLSISQGSAGGPCTFTPQANLSFTSS
jgi:hypothetical protein